MVKSSEILIERFWMALLSIKDLTCDATPTEAQKLAYEPGTPGPTYSQNSQKWVYSVCV